MKRKRKPKDASEVKQINADWLTTRDKEHLKMRQNLNRERLARSQTDISDRPTSTTPPVSGNE